MLAESRHAASLCSVWEEEEEGEVEGATLDICSPRSLHLASAALPASLDVMHWTVRQKLSPLNPIPDLRPRLT